MWKDRFWPLMCFAQVVIYPSKSLTKIECEARLIDILPMSPSCQKKRKQELMSPPSITNGKNNKKPSIIR